MYFLTIALTVGTGFRGWIEKDGTLLLGSLSFPSVSQVYYPHFRRVTNKFHEYHHNIILRFEAINFLTCHTQSELSFRFYTNPFNLEVWIFLFLTMLTFTMATDIFIAKKLKLGINSSIFFCLGSFSKRPAPFLPLNNSAFRLGMGPWLLLSSILSNVYVSLILRELNAPPEPRRFTTFQSLVPWNSSVNSSAGDLKRVFAMYKDLDGCNATLSGALNIQDYEGFSILSDPKKNYFRD